MSATITPDDGTVLALGRRFRAALDRFDNLDRRWVEMADECPGKLDAFDEAMQAQHDALGMFCAVFQRRPESLADAAVLAAHCLHHATSLTGIDLHYALENGTLETRISDLCRGLAGIVAVTTKAAGISVAEIGWTDLPCVVEQSLPGRP